MGTWFGQGAGRDALKASSCGWVTAFLGVEKGRAVYAESGSGQGRSISCPKCVKFILFASFFPLFIQSNISPPEPWAGAALEGELSALKEMQCSVWKLIPTVYWYNGMSENKEILFHCWLHDLIIDEKPCISSTVFAALPILETVTTVPYVWWEQPLCPLSAWHGRCMAVVSSQVSPTQVAEQQGREESSWGETREEQKEWETSATTDKIFCGEKTSS